MIILIITPDENVAEFTVDNDEIVENLKALIEVELSIPLLEQKLVYQGQQLTNEKRLTEYGISDKDPVLLFHVKAVQPSTHLTSSTSSPTALQEAVALRDYARSNPNFLQQLLNNNPPLAEAILSDNIGFIQEYIERQAAAKKAAEDERFRQIMRLNQNPFDLEAQKKIEEEIRLENVKSNMEAAIEHHPESFGRVTMLYVDVEVNKVPIKAFVDSGAQSTIMSSSCAERCGIMRLIDQNFAGIARGVGTAKILGRVHVAPIKIGRSFFSSSFTIIENQSTDFLLGLDYLKRHQCCIDLKGNVLRIGDEAVRFLSENELPNEFKDNPNPPNNSSVSIPPASPSALEISEATIESLVQLSGRPREAVIEMLRACGGNPDTAASYLTGND
eukprot:TRINITY_DN2916_c0_g1_i1.p1 TRINITY_DN2916_c0_g1~~TRINITY_DN2916_c0_g1_i1.p1  ORF type:complete len:388 (+),score=85.61 TRINITY_DN2916_c0_g1_i1:77-1240(+)